MQGSFIILLFQQPSANYTLQGAFRGGGVQPPASYK